MDVNRLKLLISNSNTTQKEIAEKLSISQQRFNFYVTGKREPDNEMLLRIADYFNVSIDYLLGRNEEQPAPREWDGLTVEQMELVKLFESAPAALRAAALAVLRSAEEQDKAPGGVLSAG